MVKASEIPFTKHRRHTFFALRDITYIVFILYLFSLLVHCIYFHFTRGKKKEIVLFELMLYVPVKSNGHVVTLPPFYGAFAQYYDVKQNVLHKYITQANQ